LAAARRHWQRGGGAQRDGSGSLTVARRRWQLGGGSSAGAAWRRQLGGGSLAATAWRQRVVAAWRSHGGIGSEIAALRYFIQFSHKTIACTYSNEDNTLQKILLFSNILPISTCVGYNNTQISRHGGRV
jgi:hypothetical protein